MRKSNELQIGKAGEYLVCADLAIKGLIAYPSEQGLPYDVIIDRWQGKLLKCQVKTTEKPREIPQRNKKTFAYIFNIKRHGKGGIKKYTNNEVDIFALVELENRTVIYITNNKMPDTINIRVDKLKGTYYDEQGIYNHELVLWYKERGFTQSGTARQLKLNTSTINRMWQEGYKPFKSKARYWSDYFRDIEWFQNL